MRLLGDDDLAEECVAETFSRFLHALRAGRGPQRHLKAYLFRIAHNWITDHFRRAEPVVEWKEQAAQNLPDGTPSPDEYLEDQLEQELVRRALQHLTPDQRQVVVLRFLEGWSLAEVAVALDKPVGAVKALQHRALAALRRLLAQEKGHPSATSRP
jgi:RNA polymerase sigma-70 factor (ECF subfamily)